ncbi:virion morphogenesis protein [Vibrio lentus]|nr:virion morphogenesis protein [Vibrio lentus]
MSASNKFKLNRRMANRARQFFRQQIREQRDIHNEPYQPRSRRTQKIVVKGIRGKHSAKYRKAHLVLNTVDHGNMFRGLSKSLKTHVDDDFFAVGLAGVAGAIARKHNEGGWVEFTTRVHGHYNSKTYRWEGGREVKNNYEMPQRTFLGWTTELEQELIAMAAEYFVLQLQESD